MWTTDIKTLKPSVLKSIRETASKDTIKDSQNFGEVTIITKQETLSLPIPITQREFRRRKKQKKDLLEVVRLIRSTR